MGRQSTIDEAAMFASVGYALANDGVVSMQGIVNDTGVSTGSIYNRFGSREGLLAHAWLDAVDAFQARFLEALQSDRPDAGEAAALTTPQFSRSMRARAVILATCRKSEFLNNKTPVDLSERISTVNHSAFQAISQFAKQKQKPLDVVQLALVAIPLGAVRMYLPGRGVPKSVDRYVSAAYHAVMDGI